MVKKNINKKKNLIILFSIVLVILIFISIIFLPFFKVKVIEVKGNTKVSSNSITSQVNILKSKSIFLINSDNILEQLQDQRWIENVSIKKYYFNKIVINIIERKPFVLLKNTKKKYIVDKNGFVIDKINKNYYSKLLVIKTNKKINIGKYFQKELLKALSNNYYFTKYFQKITIDRYGLSAYLDGYKVVFGNASQFKTKVKIALELKKKIVDSNQSIDVSDIKYPKIVNN